MTIILMICFTLLDIALVALVSAFTLRIAHSARARFAHSRELASCILIAIWATYGATVAFLVGYCGLGIATSQF
jgi:hypothetical protein